MNANELRIGNLIQWISTGKVEEVKDIATYDKRQANINNVSISDCKGIELTEEWLIKFGFIKRRVANMWYEYMLNYVVLDKRDGTDFDIYFSSLHQTEIKYVHQLQNLYFCLTGEELKIK